ncbi:MAG: cellulase family glycosylhydrolase [Ginsengibacter sp.]
MHRRSFIKNTSLAAAALAAGTSFTPDRIQSNSLPDWRGFNLLDFYSPDPSRNHRTTTEEHFKWMRDWGFDFVRLPLAYPCYLDIDRTKDISPDDTYKINEQAVDGICNLIDMAQKNGLHASINLHRAPGYCVNAGFNEPFNLWRDEAAQKAFYYHWAMWAKRYKNTSNKLVSFDLVNEPSMREDMNDQHSPRGPVPGDVYRKVAMGARDAIRKEKKDAIVIADGNNGGSLVIPELADLNIAQSCRGYFPGQISHYKAPWANKDTTNLPEPKWPGQVGEKYLSRQLLEDFYKPWLELSKQGVGVHCGEGGSWRRTPHDVFIAWFGDVTDILFSNNIGIALWNFIGDFGILDSGRTDVAYEDWYGHKLDRKLLNLIVRK